MEPLCHNIQSQFDAFKEGDLSKEASQEIEDHLAHCPDCRMAYKGDQELDQLLSTLPSHSCPDSVLRAIEEKTVKKRGEIKTFSLASLFPIKPFPVYAGAMAIAILIVLILKPWTPRPVASGPFTQEEILQAKAQAKWSLAYAAKTINHTQEKVVQEVFLNRLPKTMKKSIEETVPIFKGGQP